ncbi:RsfA family transcriptional regulator [Peribacillus sp. SCS-155]|uniref:RsfA family transcriptional regulator n=1 Tax=Peribacillus sedimenti TaxID=3115297 RepID=UPI003906AE9F
MSIARQDAWTQDEDLLLAELVLRHIREGSTQLRAFEEVGRRLTRTPAACGFRWNSFVRKQYKSGIELAKKQRKENKKASGEEFDFEPAESYYIEDSDLNIEETAADEGENLKDDQAAAAQVSSVTMEEVIQYLKNLDELSRMFGRERDKLLIDYEIIKRENARLLEENSRLKESLQNVESDYHGLLQIMDRARKLVVHEEDSKNHKVKFQMDKNGNLERVKK